MTALSVKSSSSFSVATPYLATAGSTVTTTEVAGVALSTATTTTGVGTVTTDTAAGAALNAGFSSLASRGPNEEPPTLNTFTQAVAHAILGCAGGAAAAGNSSG